MRREEASLHLESLRMAKDRISSAIIAIQQENDDPRFRHRHLSLTITNLETGELWLEDYIRLFEETAEVERE